MNQSEWVANVVLDMNENYDLSNRKSQLLAIRWWRMMHPLVWEEEVRLVENSDPLPANEKDNTLRYYKFIGIGGMHNGKSRYPYSKDNQ